MTHAMKTASSMVGSWLAKIASTWKETPEEILARKAGQQRACARGLAAELATAQLRTGSFVAPYMLDQARRLVR